MCSIGSGESHKIVLKRPKVHYIWWGNPKAGIGKGDEYLANAVTTPNIMAGIKNIKVMYWRQSGANDLRKQLDGSIVQHSVKKISKLFEDAEGYSMPEFMGQGIIMDNILRTLNKYSAYSAVKDFLSLCVLYKYGGYYFDTTTVIVEKTPSDIAKLLTKHDELKIVRTKTGGVFRGLDMKSKTIDATLLANTNYSVGKNLIDTHGCDVWAMYAPPKHSAIRVMIESYIERAVELGLDEYPSKKKINGTNFDLIINMNPDWKRDRKKNITDKKESIHQILKEDWPGRDEAGEHAPKKWRNHIIGQLIICAVQEGIVKYFKEKNMWEEFDNTVTPEWMWQTDEPSDEEETKKIQGVLRDIGIGKIHAGQWRKV